MPEVPQTVLGRAARLAAMKAPLLAGLGAHGGELLLKVGALLVQPALQPLFETALHFVPHSRDVHAGRFRSVVVVATAR